MIKEFIGHLHPVVVHLPIGVLLIACVFQLLSLRERYSALRSATRLSLFIGMIAAIIACLSGYFLSMSEEYDEELVTQHQWSGILLALISILFYVLYRKIQSQQIHTAITIVIIALILVTGHLGGSLTHGSDFLTKSFNNSDEKGKDERKPIPNVQDALVYNDVIEPLFKEKCYSCHGKRRQKGGLRIDQQDRLMKGGEDGAVIIPGNAEKSDMIRRLLLAREEEDHMPPKGKPQLKEHEIALIHWWISTGAPFDKKVKDLPQSEKIKPALLALQSSGEEKMIASDLPDKPVEKVNDDTLLKLREAGIVVIPVAQNTNYLLANFVSAPLNGNQEIKSLMPLQKQLLWLKLGNSAITDSALYTISSFTNLRRLRIDHTQVTDSGLAYLKKLTELRYLNLVGTNVTAEGLMQLRDLKNLQSIYLFQSKVAENSKEILKQNFPGTYIDYGGYSVPTLASDTTIVKEPEKKDKKKKKKKKN